MTASPEREGKVFELRREKPRGSGSRNEKVQCLCETGVGILVNILNGLREANRSYARKGQLPGASSLGAALMPVTRRCGGKNACPYWINAITQSVAFMAGFVLCLVEAARMISYREFAATSAHAFALPAYSRGREATARRAQGRRHAALCLQQRCP
jgi:hypothetical protein